MADLTTYELEDGIATISMDDGKVNALSIDMLKSLHADLDRAEGDEAVVILTGREGYFSAGFDLGGFAAGPDALAGLNRQAHRATKLRARGKTLEAVRAAIESELTVEALTAQAAE